MVVLVFKALRVGHYFLIFPLTFFYNLFLFATVEVFEGYTFQGSKGIRQWSINSLTFPIMRINKLTPSVDYSY